jgi:hypothetical protein
MDAAKKWYEKSGKTKPCFLAKEDIAALAAILQKNFTEAEKERFFRISTALGTTRVFANSLDELLRLPGLPEKINDLSFFIEGWDAESRFNKNVLLDFSKYSVQVNVEGTDPVWVYDKYDQLIKFLESKTAWYWPIVVMEKYFVFMITIALLNNIFIATMFKARLIYLDKIGLLALWIFLVFYDTRKIWPYAIIKLNGKKELFLEHGKIVAVVITLIFLVSLISGTIIPLVR